MQIRSITYFCDPHWPIDLPTLDRAGTFAQAARKAYMAAGYEVQSLRLATIPFPHLLPDGSPSRLIELGKALERAARFQGFDYVSLGPALPAAPWSYAAIPDLLAATQNVFASGMLVEPGLGAPLEAVQACAQVIWRTAPVSPDGFANLRFAALANVGPDSPFFPAAYHAGERPAFALATESANLVVEAFSSASSLEQAGSQLTTSLSEHARRLSEVGRQLSQQHSLPFGGIDFSLAPFPDSERSLGEAIERLGVPQVGLHGSLAAAALITSSLDQAHFPKVGFSGLMLPVLEDAVLARRAEQGVLTVKDLLLYSAVCGTGLDTVPLPGDTSPEQLAAVLLDLAALAMRLNKPLTARLMPIPGKKAGDPTNFDFAYFANSRVMALQAEPLAGVMDRGVLQITTRRPM